MADLKKIPAYQLLLIVKERRKRLKKNPNDQYAQGDLEAAAAEINRRITRTRQVVIIRKARRESLASEKDQKDN